MNKVDKLRKIFNKIKYLDINIENLDLIKKNELIENEFEMFFKVKNYGEILGLDNIFIKEDLNIIYNIYWNLYSDELDIYN